MAETPPQPTQTKIIQTDRNDHANPPKLHVLNLVAAKIQHAGCACLNILTHPYTAGPLLFTCICLALANKNRRHANNIFRRRRGRDGAGAEPIRPVLQRSMSIAVLHGGCLALQRIIDVQEARLDEATLDRAEAEFEKLLNPSDGRMRFSKLQSVVGKLEMSGKEDKAVVLLRNAMKIAKPHEAHELGMLLVEMLIYKGDYDEAFRCPCLYDEGFTDARAALYKAIIYCLKGDEKAKKNYRSFQEIQKRLSWPDEPKEKTPLYEVVQDFNKFQIIVKILKKEIEKAKESKLTKQIGFNFPSN